MRRFENGHAALSYVEDLASVRDFDEYAKVTERALAKFGFKHFVIAQVPRPGESLENSLLLEKWPQDWFELYADNNYVHADPVARYSLIHQRPFVWSDAPYDREREPRAHEVMSLASDFGMSRGLCVPARGFSRDLCVSMSGGHMELTARTRPAIHFVALYAIEAALQFSNPKPEPRSNVLTPREMEVLVWAAAGKSASETAGILNITERTITAHATNAMDKLGAANKTQAVVRAIQHRLISPEL